MLSFDAAEANCVSYGGHLAEIKSAAENAFVQSLLVSCHLWLVASSVYTQSYIHIRIIFFVYSSVTRLKGEREERVREEM
jgi:hypothetical protein